MHNKFLSLIIFLFFSQVAFSQIEDCVGAYPVCGNGTIDLIPRGTGRDDFALPGNNAPQCSFSESRSVWLKFQIKEAGTLGFDLIPDDLEGPDRDDYDFAIYGPNRPCNALGSSIRCSSTNPQAANVGAETGMNETESEYNEGPGALGNGYVHWLDNVQVGEIYYLLIDNFDQDKGFQLEWTGTAQLEDRISKENGGVDLGDDMNLCDNETTILDATTLGGTQYLWNTGDNTASIEVDEAGEYIVQVSTASGCSSRDTINVSLIPAPLIDFADASPNNLCGPVSINLSSDGSSGTYQWFSPSGNPVGSGKNVTLNNLTSQDSGNYTIRATRPNGCSDEQAVEVTIYPNPQLTITGRTEYCENEDAELTVEGAQNYEWYAPDGRLVSSSSTLPLNAIQLNQAGIYSVIGTSENGCPSTSQIQVDVLPELDLVVNAQFSICDSDALTLSATVNQAATISWKNPAGEEIGTGTSLTISDASTVQSGIYTVTATNSIGCEDEEQTTIAVNQSYQFNERHELCPGLVFNIPNTSQTVSQTDTVQVDFLTSAGCDSTYVYDIQFLSCGASTCVGIPNSFTPNNDSVNDSFRPLFTNSCEPTSFELKIFNRWGELVFSTNDHTIGWQGNIKQEPAQVGYYLYNMKMTFPDNESETIEHSGGINVLR